MMDDYDFQERCAIRIDSGMTEREAVALTDAENKSKSMFKRVEAMVKHQREHAKPVPLTIPTIEPFTDRKTIAAGDSK